MDRTADAALTDEELIRRFRGGDQAAFDALVHKHQKEIYRIAYRITGNHAEADDLAQETFCRAYTALAGFRQEASFRTWLHRIVSNLSVNVAQSARVSRRVSDLVEDLAEAGVPGTTSAPVGVETLVRRERNEKVRLAIEDLPGRQRSTLLLRVFEGLKYKEIAKVMGCTTGTAKANFSHAVSFLRRRLKEDA